jgi:hypothetical protein
MMLCLLLQEGESSTPASSKLVDEEEFALFFTELQNEMSGDEEPMDEETAREFFTAMKEEFSHEISNEEASTTGLLAEYEDETSDEKHMQADLDAIQEADFSSLLSAESSTEQEFSKSEDYDVAVKDGSDKSEYALADMDDTETKELRVLQETLPGLPLRRIKKIRAAFETTLGYPSLLTLVPILRENMPDYITLGWLKRINNKNAQFVLERAREDDQVDVPMLNAMLEVKTRSASLDGAVAFYEDEYKKHEMVRTPSKSLTVISFTECSHCS